MKSKLEQIFLKDNNWDHSDSVHDVQKYLRDGGEMLSLEQYKSLRIFVDSSYKSISRDAVASGMISERECEGVRRDLVEYLRNEHYRLLEIKKPAPIVQNREKKVGFFSKAKSYFSGFKSWEKKDKDMYALERAIHMGEGIENERELVSNITSRGASVYKREAIERMITKTIYQKSLIRIQNQINKIPRFYREVAEAA